MKLTITMVLSLSLLSLNGCATIIEGSRDPINIITAPATSATCTLTNTRGTYNTLVPSTATVLKSRSDLNVSCRDPRTGAEGKGTVVSDVEAWAFGNIIFGGLIGLGVDWGTGAAYNYPENATVLMSTPVIPLSVEGAASAPFAAPAAVPVLAAPVMVQPATVLTPAQPAYVAPVPFGAPTPASAQ
jgi:hypothetical protein